MTVEMIAGLILILLVGYIVFKIIKKIVVAFISMVFILVLLIVGLGVLLSKDIQTFQNHPTKKLLFMLVSEDESEIFAAASFKPQLKADNQKSAQSSEGDEPESSAEEFILLKGREFKDIRKQVGSKNYSELLNQYVKIVFFKPSAVDHMIKNTVSIFDLSFKPEEVKQIIVEKDPQAIVMKKSLEAKNFKMKTFLKVFKSDVEIKGGIFFGALFDQLRQDNVAVLVGLLQSFNKNIVYVKEETMLFRLIKVSPVAVAKTLLEKIQQAFGEGKIRIPKFGEHLAGEPA
ncbi:hypothetical protein ACFL27_21115 [candidate division CSSED10-310 bacterium]|uniref:Uncharacterized protein n=1 Tax=candidate division CSSED10-310 bacterium TaxID=2855610 RepID=A0ABV6Z2Q0_UNCC1